MQYVCWLIFLLLTVLICVYVCTYVQCCRKMVKLVLEGGEEEGVEIADEATLLVHRISSNVVTYCRVAMTMKGSGD